MATTIKYRTPRRELTKKDLEYFLSIPADEITLSFLREHFAHPSPKFYFQDKFTLEPGILNCKERTRTNLGRFLFNKFVLKNILEGEHLPYQNIVLDKGGITGLGDAVARLYLEDKITMETYTDFLSRQSFYLWAPANFVVPQLSFKCLIIPEKTEKLRESLFKKHSDTTDERVIYDIEKQLMDSAKEELTKIDSPIMDYFNCGARGSFASNYKSMVLLRGLVEDKNNPGKFILGKSNLVEGTTKDEQYLGANELIHAASGRSLETAYGGYMGKQLQSALGNIALNPDRESDCGTKKFLEVLITSKNKKKFYYNWQLLENNELRKLSPEALDELVGKKIKVRNAMFCKDRKICSKCAGDMYYMLNIVNIGLTFNQVGEKLKLLSMKSFHVSNIDLIKIDIQKNLTRIK